MMAGVGNGKGDSTIAATGRLPLRLAGQSAPAGAASQLPGR